MSETAQKLAQKKDVYYLKKNLFGLLLIVLLLTSCVTKQESSDTTPIEQNKLTTRWDDIIKSGELKIGVNTLDSSFDNDLIDEFAKESKLDVIKILVDEDEKEQVLNNGDVDFLWSQIPDSSENSMQYSLSKPYFNYSMLIVVKDKSDAAEWNEIGTIANSVSTEIAKRENKNVTTFDDINALFAGLETGKIDAVYINNETYNNSEVKKDEFIIGADFECNLVLAFMQNDKDVKNEVEKIMAKIKANGTASEISQKWYNKDFIIK